MTYYDDEDDDGHNPPPTAGRPAPRADFRADPSFSPRAGQPPAQPERHPMDDYVQPQRRVTPPPAAPAPEVRQEPGDAPDPHYQGYGSGAAAQQAQDAYYQEYEQQNASLYQTGAPRRRNLLNIGILAGAVIIFGGIIFYAYHQGIRAGTESVAPILRADTSPTKIRPEQPGGLEVPHQDKLVYDRLNPGSNGAPGEVERLLPPPEAPLERPRGDAQDPSEDLTLAEEGEGAAALRSPAEGPAPSPPTYAPPVAVPAPRPPQTAKPAPTQPQQLLPQQAQVTPQKPVTQALVAPPPAAVAAPPAPAPTAPPAGAGVRVQVAAVDAEGKAAAEWQRLQRKFTGELGSLSMRVVRVELPKGIFYRVQAGPVDEARAKQICAAMAAQGAGCSIVR